MRDCRGDVVDDELVAACRTLLERIGTPRLDVPLRLERLAGGVSATIVKAVLAQPLVIKFSEKRLRTSARWEAPQDRSATEGRWLEWVGQQFPKLVPRLVGRDESKHAIVLEYLTPATHSLWKTALFRGAVDVSFASDVGAALAAIHAAFARDRSAWPGFATAEAFEALRIDPFFMFTAARHPAIADRLSALAAGLRRRRITVIHGDVSPKNIFAGPAGPVFVDAECATLGDPAFDLAFCLSHLLLKARAMPAIGSALHAAAGAVRDAYSAGITWEPTAALEGRASELIPALMLARVDGKSPVEYLDHGQQQDVRAEALTWLEASPRLADLLKAPQ